jgi:hypothetical protein
MASSYILRAMNLCLLDLAELTGGYIRYGAMPPREGDLLAIARIRFDARRIEPGDVYWCLVAKACDAELALLRGAAGVVIPGRHVEPWPGRFSLEVEDSLEALDGLIAGLLELTDTAPAFSDQESSPDAAELKDLQLPAGGGLANFPPTCDRSGNRPHAHRCRRAAA